MLSFQDSIWCFCSWMILTSREIRSWVSMSWSFIQETESASWMSSLVVVHSKREVPLIQWASMMKVLLLQRDCEPIVTRFKGMMTRLRSYRALRMVSLPTHPFGKRSRLSAIRSQRKMSYSHSSSRSTSLMPSTPVSLSYPLKLVR